MQKFFKRETVKVFLKAFAVLLLLLVVIPDSINDLLNNLGSEIMPHGNSILVYKKVLERKENYTDFINIVKKLILFL